MSQAYSLSRKKLRQDFVFMFKDEIEELSVCSRGEKSKFVDNVVRYFIDYSDKHYSNTIWSVIKREHRKLPKMYKIKR